MQREQARKSVCRWAVYALLGLCAPSFCLLPAGQPALGNVRREPFRWSTWAAAPWTSQFERMDFAQKILQRQNKKPDAKELERRKD